MIRVRFTVKPNSRKNEIGRDKDGRLWLKIAAPPLEGRANLAIMLYLSGLFQIPKSAIQLQGGASGKVKTFTLEMDEESYLKRLETLVG